MRRTFNSVPRNATRRLQRRGKWFTANRPVGPVWSPGDLFGDKDNGVFYPFTPGTVFKDGTLTQELSPGDPVGFVLDASGAQYGKDLIPNGGFDVDSDWTKGAGWTIAGGQANCDGTQGAGTLLEQPSIVTQGNLYAITYTITELSAGIFNTQIAGNPGEFRTATGTYTDFLVATDADTRLLLRGDVDFVGAVDNVSVRQVVADNLEQTDQDKQPIYTRHPKSGVRNLLDLSDAMELWTIPGTATDLTLDRTGGVGPKGEPCNRLTFNGGARDAFERVKDETEQVSLQLAIRLVSGSPDGIEIGTRNGNVIPVTPTAQWQIVSGTFTDSGFPRVQGVNSFCVLDVCNAQLEYGATATAYQSRVSQYDVTETGQTDCYGLTFSSNDNMSTVSGLVLSGSDSISVVAGVFKETDVSAGWYLNQNSNIAPFIKMTAPNVAGLARLAFQTAAGALTNEDYPAPVSFVASGIATPALNTYRINGVGSGTMPGAAGMYGDEPLYLGSRSTNVSYFNGTLYATTLIDRELTDDELAQLEGYTIGVTPDIQPPVGVGTTVQFVPGVLDTGQGNQYGFSVSPAAGTCTPDSLQNAKLTFFGSSTVDFPNAFLMVFNGTGSNGQREGDQLETSDKQLITGFKVTMQFAIGNTRTGVDMAWLDDPNWRYQASNSDEIFQQLQLNEGRLCSLTITEVITA